MLISHSTVLARAWVGEREGACSVHLYHLAGHLHDNALAAVDVSAKACGRRTKCGQWDALSTESVYPGVIARTAKVTQLGAAAPSVRRSSASRLACASLRPYLSHCPLSAL
uniref:Uncharacterized protein n=1 Tax=Plectus sambesii TaxID=2011161 RepID=A0A914WFY2_9BILA